MKNKIKLNKLIEELNIASAAYYNSGNTIMSDREFDTKLKELELLEKETGIVMSNSPTQRVGAPVLNKLDKIVHEHKPMLSLAKTHSAEEIVKFANGKELIAMIKLDGLSVRLTYQDGKLIKAETRGDGAVGSLITEHIKQFKNVPLSINKKGTYVVDGEAIISESDFEAINTALPEGTEKFKNSRNLASGTLSLLDTSLVKERHLRFVLWDVITGSNLKDNFNFEHLLEEAELLGFEVVSFMGHAETLEAINISNKMVLEKAKYLGYPCDGVVWKLNDIKYGESLGQTSHHFNNAVAFKFRDDVHKTKLKEIEWSMGKTGTLCPVAIFEPVEIEGSTIERASVHNVSILTELDLRPGDTITIFKANAIIPQISENLSSKGRVPEYMKLPGCCPVCGGPTEVRRTNDTDVLVCTNDNCEGKLLGRLSHAVSKNALDIEGMSEATLELLIEKGWVNSIKDLYHLNDIKSEWIKCDRFKIKSVDKLLAAIEKSRETTMERFLYAQSINLIGRTASKDISKFCNGDVEAFCEMMTSDTAKKFLEIDGFGETMYQSLTNWKEKQWNEFLELKREFNFINTNKTELNNINKNGIDLEGKTFCITGKLIYCENRDKLVSIIESHNGRYVTGVTSKTNYLVNNDTESLSSKNKKAKELGCKIISEKDLLNMIGII